MLTWYLSSAHHVANIFTKPPEFNLILSEATGCHLLPHRSLRGLDYDHHSNSDAPRVIARGKCLSSQNFKSHDNSKSSNSSKDVKKTKKGYLLLLSKLL